MISTLYYMGAVQMYRGDAHAEDTVPITKYDLESAA